MPTLTRLICALSALIAATLMPSAASAACTTATASTSLGSASSYAVGTTRMRGLSELRVKESDRLAAVAARGGRRSGDGGGRGVGGQRP